MTYFKKETPSIETSERPDLDNIFMAEEKQKIMEFVGDRPHSADIKGKVSKAASQFVIYSKDSNLKTQQQQYLFEKFILKIFYFSWVKFKLFLCLLTWGKFYNNVIQ